VDYSTTCDVDDYYIDGQYLVQLSRPINKEHRLILKLVQHHASLLHLHTSLLHCIIVSILRVMVMVVIGDVDEQGLVNEW
jgi:hypothetical protein